MYIKREFTNIKNQVYATLIANCIILGHGLGVGWFSPALPILLSDSTPLATGPLSYEDVSWMTSLSSVGAIVGVILFGIISSKIGYKRSLPYLTFPYLTYWIIVRFGNKLYYYLFARFITGWTVGGMGMGVALFVSEICNDNIRGRLASVSSLARNVGVLCGYIIGGLFSFENRPYISICVPIIYFIGICLLPNTPQYYVRKGDRENAEKSLKFYKGCKGNTVAEKSFLNVEFARLELIAEEQKLNKKIRFGDFFNRTAVKGITTSIAMAWFQQMPGSMVFVYYATVIFEKSDSIVDPNVASIILACVQIFGGLVSTQLGDLGRKINLSISLFGSAVGLFTFSVYMYLHHNGYDISNFTWLPVVVMSFIIFISNAGIIALANICAVENFQTNIRTTGLVFYTLCFNCVAFVCDKYFPIMLQVYQLHGCLLFLAINCCFGLVFVYFMDETRGKSLDDVNAITKSSTLKKNDS